MLKLLPFKHQVLQFPSLEWDADPSALYTVMIVDMDIERPGLITSFMHYLEVNVQGSECYSLTHNCFLKNKKNNFFCRQHWHGHCGLHLHPALRLPFRSQPGKLTTHLEKQNTLISLIQAHLFLKNCFFISGSPGAGPRLRPPHGRPGLQAAREDRPPGGGHLLLARGLCEDTGEKNEQNI